MGKDDPPKFRNLASHVLGFRFSGGINRHIDDKGHFDDAERHLDVVHLDLHCSHLTSMSLRLPIGLSRALCQGAPVRAASYSFFSAFSPARAGPSSRPIGSTISQLCFFSPSTLTRSAPRIPYAQLRSLNTRSRSPFDGLARRSFSTSRPGWIRQTYFPKRGGYGGSGGGGGRGGPGWFRNFRARIDAIPPIAIVSLHSS